MLAYDRTDVLLIALSVVNRNTFRNVKDFWMKEFEKNKAKFGNAKVRVHPCTPHHIPFFHIKCSDPAGRDEV